MQHPREPTIFVVDDDPAMRDSLRWLFGSVSLAVETFATAEEFLEACDPSRPGCLLLDVRMPGMSGLNLQEELAARHFTLPIIIITGFAEVTTAVRALKTGAIDFIQKPFSDELLLERIREAIKADQQAREAHAERSQIAERFATLTARERAVMELVIAGKANKVVAAELGLSAKTVEVHRSNMMRKTGADSVADLVRRALVLKGKP